MFTELFRAHWTAVHAYARRRTGDPTDAHDVAAETFTVAWRRFDELPADHLLPWLYRTAANVLANRARTSRRQDRLVAKAGAAPTAPDALLDDTVVDDRALVDAFAALPDDQRELLRLVAWEGLTNDEIAAVLGITTNAAALRVSRARARFEELLTAADEEAPTGSPTPGPTTSGPAGHGLGDRTGRRTTS